MTGFKRASRLRGLSGRLALAAVSLLLTLVLAEAALRLVPSRSPPAADDDAASSFAGYHPRLGWDHLPGGRGRLRSDEFDVAVRINAQGMRADRDYRPRPAPGIRRLVLIGDSFSFGHGVAVEDTWGERLARALPATEVLNLAVSGYGTDQQLLKLLDQGLAYGPHLVLLGMFEGNVFRNARAVHAGYPKPRFERLAGGGLKLLGTPVPRQGAVAPGWLHGSRLVERLGRPAWSLAEHLGFGAAWPITAAIVARLAAVSAEHGAALAAVVVPKDGAVYGGGPRHRLHRHTLARIDALLAEAGVDHLDLTPALAAAASSASGERLYFAHDGHWTPAGHRRAASAVAAWLRDKIPSAAARSGS